MGRPGRYSKKGDELINKLTNRSIVFIIQQGATVMPIKLPFLKTSGTKITVKVVAPIAVLQSSIRSNTVNPAKGTKNPPHIHVNVPQSARPKDP